MCSVWGVVRGGSEREQRARGQGGAQLTDNGHPHPHPPLRNHPVTRQYLVSRDHSLLYFMKIRSTHHGICHGKSFPFYIGLVWKGKRIFSLNDNSICQRYPDILTDPATVTADGMAFCEFHFVFWYIEMDSKLVFIQKKYCSTKHFNNYFPTADYLLYKNSKCMNSKSKGMKPSISEQ